MSDQDDSGLLDIMCSYTIGIIYLAIVNILTIPLYIVLNYLILAIGLNNGFILILAIIQVALNTVISNKNVLNNLAHIDFTSVSNINPVNLQSIGLISLLLSLLMLIVNYVFRNNLYELISIILWIIYLSTIAYTTYLFHKVYNNSILGFSVISSIVIMFISFIIKPPYSYILVFIPFLLKQHGLKSIIEIMEKGKEHYVWNSSVFEQVIRSTVAELRDTILKNTLDSFKSIGKAGIYLLIASIINTVFILPSVFPYFTYVFKLPVIDIEPSMLLKIIVINRFTNWDFIQEYISVIIISTIIYSLVVVLEIAGIYSGLCKASTLLSIRDSEYAKLSFITYIVSIIYAIQLLLLIIPMFIAIQFYVKGISIEYADFISNLILNDVYVYVPIIYVFLTGSIALFATVFIVNKVSRDFSSTALNLASNIIPIAIFLNVIRTIALLIQLIDLKQFIWITEYTSLITFIDLSLSIIIYIFIGYGGYSLYNNLYGEIVGKTSFNEE